MIELKKVYKTYKTGSVKKIDAISNTSLTLPEVGMIAIFGKSGCGKTTLLNAIGGLDTVDSGAIKIDGVDITKLSTSAIDRLRNKSIGYIFQNYNLVEDMTVLENVALGLRLSGETDENIINKKAIFALEQVGMDRYKKRNPRSLSGGQQQRVSIARAIVKGAKIIIADEPTGNLDEENTSNIMRLLKTLSKDKLIILVTHEEIEVQRYADWRIDIVEGKVFTSEAISGRGAGILNSNEVYLGEMNHIIAEKDSIKVEVFSNKNDEVNIRLIERNGTYYLESKGVEVRFMTSEIKVREGKKPKGQLLERDSHKIDLGILNEVNKNEKSVGKAFTLKQCFKQGLSDILSTKKKNKLFMAFTTIAVFALSMLIFMFSMNIRYFIVSTNEYNLSSIRVVNADAQELTIIEKMAQDEKNGINNWYIRSSNFNEQGEYAYGIDEFYYEYNYGSFLSSSFTTQYIGLIEYPVSFARQSKLLYGKKELARGEVLITKGLVEFIRQKMGFNFSDNDLLYSKIGNKKIVGIIEGAERELYKEETDLASERLYNNGRLVSFTNFKNSDISDEDLEISKLEKGEVLLQVAISNLGDASNNYFKNIVGTKQMIFGKEVLVKGISYTYSSGNSSGVAILKDPNKKYALSVLNAVFCDEDVLELSLYNKGITYYIYENGSDVAEERIGNGFVIDFKSSNWSQAKKVLTDAGLTVITVADSVERIKTEAKTTILIYLVMIICVYAIVALCMFFSYKALSYVRKKEIGIYRAIGASKTSLNWSQFIGNLIKTCIFVILTFVVALLVFKLIANEELIWWVNLIAGILLTGTSLLVGQIPLWIDLEKTPAQMLSGYDM